MLERLGICQYYHHINEDKNEMTVEYRIDLVYQFCISYNAFTEP